MTMDFTKSLNTFLNNPSGYGALVIIIIVFLTVGVYLGERLGGALDRINTNVSDGFKAVEKKQDIIIRQTRPSDYKGTFADKDTTPYWEID